MHSTTLQVSGRAVDAVTFEGPDGGVFVSQRVTVAGRLQARLLVDRHRRVGERRKLRQHWKVVTTPGGGCAS